MVEIANELSDLGFKIALLTNCNSSNFYFLKDNISVIELSHKKSTKMVSRFLFSIYKIIQIRRTILNLNPRSVLSFVTKTNVSVILALFFTSIRVVVSERSDPSLDTTIGRSLAILRRLIYRFADLVVVQTSEISDWTRANTNSTVKVIPNPIRDLPTHTSTKPEKIILSTGRLSREKGFDILIKAFALCHNKLDGWKLIIVGSGGEKQSLETLISESGLVGVIEIHDATKFIDDWYFKSLIFVQSSRFEGMPNSLLEAMAHGLSVIATLNAGSSIITHQEDGLLVPSESVSDLADAIALLVDNVDLRNRMGKKALRVRQRFASSLVMPMWIDVLN